MGLQTRLITFTTMVPGLRRIENQFFANTGLMLEPITALNLVEIPGKPRTATDKIAEDADEYYQLIKTVTYIGVESYEEYIAATESLNHIGALAFYVEGFYRIFVGRQANTLQLECDVGRYYFFEAVTVCLEDLGGVSQGNRSRKTRLRKWIDYSWYNRPNM